MAASSAAESSCDAPSLSSSAETNILSSILRHFSFRFPVLVVAPSPLHTRTCSTTKTFFSLLSSPFSVLLFLKHSSLTGLSLSDIFPNFPIYPSDFGFGGTRPKCICFDGPGFFFQYLLGFTFFQTPLLKLIHDSITVYKCC